MDDCCPLSDECNDRCWLPDPFCLVIPLDVREKESIADAGDPKTAQGDDKQCLPQPYHGQTSQALRRDRRGPRKYTGKRSKCTRKSK